MQTPATFRTIPKPQWTLSRHEQRSDSQVTGHHSPLPECSLSAVCRCSEGCACKAHEMGACPDLLASCLISETHALTMTLKHVAGAA